MVLVRRRLKYQVLVVPSAQRAILREFCSFNVDALRARVFEIR